MNTFRKNQDEDFNNLQDQQNVQRLGNQENSNSFPIVLGDFIKHDDGLLEERMNLIENNLTKGNNKAMAEYKSKLPLELNTVQFDWSLGLVLGDATLQANSSEAKKAVQLKIQQANFNHSLLDITLEILKPWVFRIVPVSGRPMQEIATIQHTAFVPLAKVFQDPSEELKPKACVRKVIPKDISKYLSPIAVGAWYCFDGGRRDYGKNEGKAIQLHTQGFSKECVDQLATALKSRYGWNANCKFDYTSSKGKDLYLIQVEADSFEAFVSTIDPYILPEFKGRLPKPRSPRSRFNP